MKSPPPEATPACIARVHSPTASMPRFRRRGGDQHSPGRALDPPAVGAGRCGLQGSAACGRKSDRSSPAAACLGGPQRGPGRLSGNPDHRPLHSRQATVPAVGARIARPRREAASRGGYGGCGKPFVSRHNPSGRPQACHLPLHRGGGEALAGTFGGYAPAIRLVCLRRGTFHRGKVPKTRRGLRPPVPRGAARRASPEEALPGPLRATGLSRPILPAPSRLRAGQ